MAPYIFRFMEGDESKIEMCCPCGNLERPTEFKPDDGGYVVMEKKPLQEEDTEEKATIAAMTEEQKIKAYMTEFMAEIPAERLQPADTPQKIMKVTKVETRVVMLKMKYGMEVANKVDQIIMQATESNEVSDEYDEALVNSLMKVLVDAGFIEPRGDKGEVIDECEAETAKIKDKFKAKKEEKRQAKEKSEEQEKAQQEPKSDDVADQVTQDTEVEVEPQANWLPVYMVAMAAAATAFIWWRSRKA